MPVIFIGIMFSYLKWIKEEKFKKKKKEKKKIRVNIEKVLDFLKNGNDINAV